MLKALSVVRGTAGRTVLLALLGTGAVGLVLGLLYLNQGRLALTATFTIMLVAAATVHVRWAILLSIVYVTFLGDFRRLVIPLFGWSGTDPLLMVGTLVAALIMVQALVAKTLKLDTSLSRWMAGLMVIMVLQIFNPAQGGLMVGIAGAMFIIGQLCWYWLSRTYATPALVDAILFRWLPGAAVVAVVLGIYQVFFGYLPHQQLWVDMNWYAGLGDPANPAPISLFASNTEYGGFLSLATVVCWAGFLRGRRTLLLLIPLYLTGILLTGSRGPVFFTLAVMVGLWAVQGTNKATWILRGSLAAVLAATGLVWSLTHASQLGLGDHVQGRLDRQAQEFIHARTGEEEHSSAENHFRMMLGGYTFTLRQPLGLGLGAVTKASGKFGGRAYSTETHFGNSFVALGLPGGVVYHVVMVLIVLATFRYWLRSRSATALALMAVIGTTQANLMAGEMYAIGPLIALAVGAVDRLERQSRPPADS